MCLTEPLSLTPIYLTLQYIIPVISTWISNRHLKLLCTKLTDYILTALPLPPSPPAARKKREQNKITSPIVFTPFSLWHLFYQKLSQKSSDLSLTLLFISYPHPDNHQMLLDLLSKYIQDQTNSLHLHCFHPNIS